MRSFFSSRLLSPLIFIIVLGKIFFFLYFKFLHHGKLFGGSNDSEYYNAYAEGYIDYAVNFWPIILRFFNGIGLYNRDLFSLMLFFFSLTLIPYFFYKVVKDSKFNIKSVKLMSIFIIVFYPTIFFLTLDVYRDVFMYTVFLLCLLFYRKVINSGFFLKFPLLLLFFCMSYFLFLLRPYLGGALIISAFTYFIFNSTRNKIKTWVIIYFIFLMLAKSSGILNSILEYRGEDGFLVGGSTLGIGLLNMNPLMFLIYYLYSFFAQVFGFFFVNFNSVLVFIFESIPFIWAFFYIIKNIRFLTKFCSFLLIFFVVYTTVWVLGNDNLGTAVRLRVPSYLVIFACMFIVYQEKLKFTYFNR